MKKEKIRNRLEALQLIKQIARKCRCDSMLILNVEYWLKKNTEEECQRCIRRKIATKKYYYKMRTYFKKYYQENKNKEAKK